MKPNEIAFNFKARYYKSAAITADTKEIWFVLHGYGQLAQYFIRKFSALTERNICVIAPEGLSRFYLESIEAGTGRKNDRVGATWMTKENRLMDIENYIAYLNQIYDKEVSDTKIPVTVLGFSQGSATASRWVMAGHINFTRLVLWAGIFPPDMNFDAGKNLLQQKEVIVTYGKEDPFLNDARFLEMNQIIQKLSVEVKSLPFEGGHEIDQETLLKIIEPRG